MSARCRNEFEVSGCLGVADPQWEMRFDDIGEPPIGWCSKCGPGAAAIDAFLSTLLSGPRAAEVQRMIEAAERERSENAS